MGLPSAACEDEFAGDRGGNGPSTICKTSDSLGLKRFPAMSTSHAMKPHSAAQFAAVIAAGQEEGMGCVARQMLLCARRDSAHVEAQARVDFLCTIGARACRLGAERGERQQPHPSPVGSEDQTFAPNPCKAGRLL